MPTSQEQADAKLSAHLLNKTLTDIEFYNVNDDYYEIKENHSWVFDGGVELKFGDELLSLGWNYEGSFYDCSMEQSMTELFGEAPHHAVDAKSIHGITQLVGKEITEASFEWEFYQEYDDEGQLKEEKIYTPIGFRLRFSDHSLLQLGLVKFSFNPETREFINFRYNLDGLPLVSVNNDIEIEA